MAPDRKKSKENILNYKHEINLLVTGGPQRLYLLYGPEEYLRERYIEKLVSLCFPEGETGFGYTKIDGSSFDIITFEEAVNSVPFLSEKTYVEIRNLDINKMKEQDSEKFMDILSDIPEYCTVNIILAGEYEPDNRKKVTKFLQKNGVFLKFTHQTQGALLEWITRRFAAQNKAINMEAAQRLIFISGDIMSKLIPEIEKIAAFSSDRNITVDDVNTIANHIPEADIFDAIELISEKKYNQAAESFAVLLNDKANEPIYITAILGMQFKRLYFAKTALECGENSDYISSKLKVPDFVARKMCRTVRDFVPGFLESALRICADTDYKMKSTSQDDADLLREAFSKIIAGDTSNNA